MKKLKIAVLCGDGIGKEVLPEAVKVLRKVGRIHRKKFEFRNLLIGQEAHLRAGNFFPEKTKKGCDNADAILFGAVENEPLLELRGRYEFYANIRPVSGKDLDLTIFRELCGGIYFGEKGMKQTGLPDGSSEVVGYHVMEYSKTQIERIARLAFSYAREHHKRVISIDKDNALPMLRWRETVREIAAEFPEVQLTNMYIDNAIVQLYLNPRQFEAVVSSNLFGDIFSDLAAAMAGSIGTAPSASINEGGFGMFEPVHGTAPDIAGKGIANPIGAILSAAMMLEQFELVEAAASVRHAVATVLEKFATMDMADGKKQVVPTAKMGDLITAEVGK